MHTVRNNIITISDCELNQIGAQSSGLNVYLIFYEFCLSKDSVTEFLTKHSQWNVVIKKKQNLNFVSAEIIKY